MTEFIRELVMVLAPTAGVGVLMWLLNTKDRTRSGKISEFESINKRRDEHIKDLQKQIDDLRADVRTHSDKREEQEREIYRLRSEILLLRAQLTALGHSPAIDAGHQLSFGELGDDEL